MLLLSCRWSCCIKTCFYPQSPPAIHRYCHLLLSTLQWRWLHRHNTPQLEFTLPSLSTSRFTQGITVPTAQIFSTSQCCNGRKLFKFCDIHGKSLFFTELLFISEKRLTLGIALVHHCLESLMNCCGQEPGGLCEFIKTNAPCYAELHFVWFRVSLHRAVTPVATSGSHCHTNIH